MTTPTATALPSEPIMEPTVESIAAIPLTLKDRCCACSSGTAQAFVRVNILTIDGDEGELLFCGHHYAKHEAALAARETVLSVQDERDKINEKPSQSSV